MKTLKRTKAVILAAALLFTGIWFGNLLTGRAAETEEQTQMLMQLEADAAVYEEAGEDSTVTATLPKGTAVICTKTESEQWYQVSYQEIKGYVQAEAVGMYGDTEELNGEFGEIHEEI